VQGMRVSGVPAPQMVAPAAAWDGGPVSDNFYCPPPTDRLCDCRQCRKEWAERELDVDPDANVVIDGNGNLFTNCTVVVDGQRYRLRDGLPE
jgi:hypothetical protein